MRYNRSCPGCGKDFSTNYWNKKYCGSKSCEIIRQTLKNKSAQERRVKSPSYKEKAREHYFRNRKNILEYKREKYRQEKKLSPDKHRGPRVLIESISEPISHVDRNSQRLEYEAVKSMFKKEGYTLLSRKYKNNHTNLSVLCPENHLVNTCFMSFSRGNRCSECAKRFTQSTAEREILESLKVLDKNLVAFSNFQLFDNRQEVDLYFPEQKVAVEYCGLHWHKESMLKTRLSKSKDVKSYHRDKMNKCLEKGIRLITIFEDEYLDKPQVVLSRISNALGIGHQRIYARDCKVSVLTNREAVCFLDNYHLQNSSPCQIAWGLEFEGRLLQVLSAGSVSRKHTSGNQNFLELKRFASLPFITVVGGFSKLLKPLIIYAVENNYTALKSYADMRYANPFQTVYGKVGFQLIGETSYSPHYVLGKRRYRNQSLRKTSEERLVGKTEWELREAQGYDRIWDCGHKTYVYGLEK